MKIQWLGHACFLFVSKDGTRVLTDPFDPKVGYPVPEVAADIVTASHQHSDHNYFKAVQGQFTRVEKPGETTLRGVHIKGVSTFHDDTHGSQRGQNILFRFTIDGLNILHCGDLGHALTPEQVQAVGPLDVLILPVGGYYTINAATAQKVMQQLNPALTIPMHFKTPVMDFPIESVDPFLNLVGGGRRAGKAEIEVSREDVKEKGGVVVLEYPR